MPDDRLQTWKNICNGLADDLPTKRSQSSCTLVNFNTVLFMDCSNMDLYNANFKNHIYLIPIFLSHFARKLGNSPDKLCHTRSVAYSVELVLNKHQIAGGGAYLDCHRKLLRIVQPARLPYRYSSKNVSGYKRHPRSVVAHSTEVPIL